MICLAMKDALFDTKGSSICIMVIFRKSIHRSRDLRWKLCAIGWVWGRMSFSWVGLAFCECIIFILSFMGLGLERNKLGLTSITLTILKDYIENNYILLLLHTIMTIMRYITTDN